jgi:hypothetical protein
VSAALGGHADREAAAAAFLALGRDRPAVRLDDAERRRQASPSPAELKSSVLEEWWLIASFMVTARSKTRARRSGESPTPVSVTAMTYSSRRSS